MKNNRFNIKGVSLLVIVAIVVSMLSSCAFGVGGSETETRREPVAVDTTVEETTYVNPVTCIVERYIEGDPNTCRQLYAASDETDSSYIYGCFYLKNAQTGFSISTFALPYLEDEIDALYCDELITELYQGDDSYVFTIQTGINYTFTLIYQKTTGDIFRLPLGEWSLCGDKLVRIDLSDDMPSNISIESYTTDGYYNDTILDINNTICGGYYFGSEELLFMYTEKSEEDIDLSTDVRNWMFCKYVGIEESITIEKTETNSFNNIIDDNIWNSFIGE